MSVAPVVLEDSPKNVIEDRYAIPDNFIGAYNALQDAWVQHVSLDDKEEPTLSEIEARNTLLARGAAILARSFGAVPAWGVSPEPRVDRGEVAFTETADVPNVTMNPYGAEPFTLDLEVGTGDKAVYGYLARMREVNGVGVKMVTSFQLTAEGRLTSWGNQNEPTTLIEIYKQGRESYALRVDNSGKVVGASRFDYAKNKPGFVTAAAVIPLRERRSAFFTNRERADSMSTEDDSSATKVDVTEEFQGKTVNLEELDGILRTVDQEGNLLKQPDLPARITALLFLDTQ